MTTTISTNPADRGAREDAIRQQKNGVDLVDVHSLHKSGTMFLYKFFKQLSERQSYQFLSANNSPPEYYDAASLQQQIDQVEGSSTTTVCRAPIRSFELDQFALNEREFELASHKRIFHLRDPRDMLVSEYYSFGWTHPTEQQKGLESRRQEIQQMSVDEYVVTQAEVCTWPVDQKYAPLANYEFDLEHELVVTYEQMVTSFYKWCYAILNFLDVKHAAWLTAKLAWKYRNEFKVAGESLKHKRRIKPGDHRDKLDPKSISILNERFETILKRFGYLS
ncbi:MAG: sulfotransferase domain-containing protein [Planctomycetota bacterium]